MLGIPHPRMQRLNLSQAGSCDVMLILASPSTAAWRGEQAYGREFADSCGTTARTEWQQPRSGEAPGCAACRV